MEGHRSGTRPHTLATTTTVKAMVAPPDGSPLRITQRATAGLRDGSLRHTAVGWTTAKVMVGRQSGGQEDFETKLPMNEHFCTASSGDHPE
jgi:hypothetical protein